MADQSGETDPSATRKGSCIISSGRDTPVLEPEYLPSVCWQFHPDPIPPQCFSLLVQNFGRWLGVHISYPSRYDSWCSHCIPADPRLPGLSHGARRRSSLAGVNHRPAETANLTRSRLNPGATREKPTHLARCRIYGGRDITYFVLVLD